MQLSIVLPAYNEADEVGRLVSNIAYVLRQGSVSFEIVVVDNGSTDATPAVLEELKKEVPELRTTRVFPNRGFGNGILAGLKIAGGDVLGWMPADGQLAAADLRRVYEHLGENGCDVAKGMRTERNDTLPRRVQSMAYNFLFQALFGVALRDINAPPKLFKRPVYEKAGLSSKDWFIDAELIIKATAMNARICETPAEGRLRASGASKVRVGTIFEFLKNMIAYKLKWKK